MIWIFKKVLGSVTLAVQGADIEGFLREAAQKGGSFDNVKRLDADMVSLETGLENYFLLRSMAKRAMCKIKVVKKTGLPFKAEKISKRLGLICGVLFCIFAFAALSSLVWTIEINCHETPVTEVQVLKYLNELRLKTGTPAAKIKPKEVKLALELMDENIAAAYINRQGTHLRVDVWGQEPQPHVASRDEPCDVISDKSGVIISMRIKEGQALVKVGDSVLKGDKIASGSMVSTSGKSWLVHAIAEIDLRVWHNERRRLPQRALAYEETGKIVKRHGIIVGKQRIDFYLIENEPFACYYKKVEKTPLTLKEDFRFPVIFFTETFYETTPKQIDIDKDKAAEILKKAMEDTLAREKPDATLRQSRFELVDKDGVFEGVFQAECLETAGVEQPINR